MESLPIPSPLIKRVRQEIVFLSPSLIDHCAELGIGTMQEAERSARSVALRVQLADAAHALSQCRAALRHAFPARLDEAIARALDAARGAAASAARPALGESGLALLEHAEVSRFVEASRLQQAVMPVVEAPLTRLDSLMSSVLGLPVVRADLNPLRPDVLCEALLAALEEQPAEPPWRALWVRHIAAPYAHELGRSYEAIVQLLEDAGVEQARYRLKLSESAAPRPGAGEEAGAAGRGAGQGPAAPGSAGPAGAGGGAPRADAARPQRPHVLRMGDLAQPQPVLSQALMHDFLYRPQWMAEHDEPLPAAYYAAVEQETRRLAAAPVAHYDEAAAARLQARARALSVVDRPARQVAPDHPLSPDEWGDLASAQARSGVLMALKSQTRRTGQVLGLDVVRTLVGQVADDGRVLAPVREAVVALEPALLRMAMAEPRFFGEDQHPARRLIEGVAQRSFRYNDEYSEEFEHFMAPVRQAVRQLSAQPEARQQDFADRLQALQADWQRQDEAERLPGEQGLRSMQFAQERQALADKVAWEFSLRSDLSGVPRAVTTFLFEDWSLVIAHAQLTDERGQLDPGGYLAVVTDLLWSVRSEAALKEPARLFDVVPGIVQTLRRGLQMLGKDPQEAQTFFDALMRCHDPVLRLRRLRSARDAQSSGYGSILDDPSALAPLESDAAPLEPPKPRTAEQPWLGQRERAAAGFELGQGDSGAAPLVPGGVLAAAAEPGDAGLAGTLAHERTEHVTQASDAATSAGAVPAAAAGGAETPDDADARTRAALARLRTGDWCDLKVRGQWRRAQLHWSSANGALFMFISDGGRPHSMTRRTCERLLRARDLRPLDTGAVMGRAMGRLRDPARVATAA